MPTKRSELKKIECLHCNRIMFRLLINLSPDTLNLIEDYLKVHPMLSNDYELAIINMIEIVLDDFLIKKDEKCIDFKEFQDFLQNPEIYQMTQEQDSALKKEELELSKIERKHIDRFLFRRHQPNFIEELPKDIVRPLERVCSDHKCHYKQGFKEGFAFAKHLMKKSLLLLKGERL